MKQIESDTQRRVAGLLGLGGRVFARATSRDGTVREYDFTNTLTVEFMKYLLGAGLAGSPAAITTWYMGLKGTGSADPGYSATYATKGFTEITNYDEANRQTWQAQTPEDGTVGGSVVVHNDDGDGTTTWAAFTWDGASADVYGIFLASFATKGDSAESGAIMANWADFDDMAAMPDGGTLEVMYEAGAYNVSPPS
jgi:hypothetical protein